MVREWRTNQMTEQDIFDELRYEIVRDEYGIFYYNSLGQRHRENDLPAAIHADGTQAWFMNGQPHRENDEPAVIYPNGMRLWYMNGKFIK